MIDIPTCELTGIISDVLPFACADKDLPTINSVRIWWDGFHLHAEATDRYVIGRAEWQPGDDPDIDAQEQLGTEWGGADNPWSVIVGVADAKDIVTVFKLPPKEGWTKLTVDLIDGRLKISRHRDTGHSALTHVIQPYSGDYPNLDKLLDGGPFLLVDEIAFNAKALAGFAKVRQRGPLEVRFTGVHKPALVTIGARFVGAIMPVRTGVEETPVEAEPAANHDDMDALV